MSGASSPQILAQAVGRTETMSAWTAPHVQEALAATLPLPLCCDGVNLPLLGHWLYGLPSTPAAEIGPDGHPRAGGFIPDTGLPRRMWASGDLTFHRPVPLGAQVERCSTIRDVAVKSGRSGRLVFVTVEHVLGDARGLAISETQSIVYRDAAPTGAPSAVPVASTAPSIADWEREVAPDPILLFRYSALTFNSHRIHYDRPYAMGVEGYAGLVVQGPLVATLLLHAYLATRPGARVRRYRFRAISPVIDTAPFILGGHSETVLFVRDTQRRVCMEAAVELAPPESQILHA